MRARARFPMLQPQAKRLMMGRSVSMLGLVLGPQLLNGWAINWMSIVSVLGVAGFVVFGCLPELVANRLTIFVHL